jgi:Flagellar biosynthesis protein, FliO
MLNELQPYLPMLVIALIVLIAIIIMILIYKLFNQRVRGRKGQRLGITEFHEIDKTRRIVLVRRDDVEHLVMIGGNQDLVIESNIESGLAGSSSFSTRAAAEEPVSMRTPKPAVFGSRRPILRSVEPSMTNDGREEDDAR